MQVSSTSSQWRKRIFACIPISEFGMVLTTLKTPSCHRTNSRTESGPHYIPPRLPPWLLYNTAYLFPFTLICCLLPECFPVQNFSLVQLRWERVKIYLWVATGNSHVCNFMTLPHRTMWTKTIPFRYAPLRPHLLPIRLNFTYSYTLFQVMVCGYSHECWKLTDLRSKYTT